MPNNTYEHFIAEYQALRSEINQRIANSTQVYSFYIAALVLIFGFSLEKGFYDVLLFMPFISWAVFFHLIWNDLVIIRISDHLGKLSFDLFAKDHPNSFTWDNKFWEPNRKNLSWRHSYIFLFSVCSVGPSIVFAIQCFCALFKGKALPGKMLSELPTWASTSIVIALFGWAIYVFIEVIRKTFSVQRTFIVTQMPSSN